MSKDDGINWEDEIFDMNMEKNKEKAKDGSLKASTRVLAKLMKGYYDSLVEQGFDKEMAYGFTMDYQRSLLEGYMVDNNKNEES